MPEPPAISEAEIADALRRSGYLIEYRIEDVLRGQGYHVAANATYPDPITLKPRELDISATGAERIGSDKDWLFNILLIECTNNSYPLAFLTKEPQAEFVHVYDIFVSGIPAHIRHRGHNKKMVWSRISEYLGIDKCHHYCEGRIATQFCSFAPKRNTKPVEWMAWHEEGHFESFGKLCAALNYDIEDHYNSATLVSMERINLQMYFPILVVGGEILDVRHNAGSMEMENVDHIHYIQSSIVRGKQTNYHIDVVTERFFPRLIEIIAKDKEQFAKRAEKQKRALNSAIDEIVKAANRYPEELQNIIRPRT